MKEKTLESVEGAFVTINQRRSKDWMSAKVLLHSFTRTVRRRAVALARRGTAKPRDLWVCPIIGCNAVQFAEHLESQFKDGMTWDNFASVWEIDHIKPLRLFDLTDQIEFRKCAHYSNTRPLFIPENHEAPTIPPGLVNKPRKVMKNGKPHWMIDLRPVGLGRRFSTRLQPLVEKCRRETLALGGTRLTPADLQDH